MSVGWVAATTRGRSLLGRLVGADGARTLALAGSWPACRAQLGTTIYGAELPATADRPTARKAAATATSWQLRVLAGWLPPVAGGLARLFAAPLEIANIEQRLGQLAGATPVSAIPLGSLSVAWPRVAAATSADQVREVLVRSAWGDPGDPESIGTGLRVAWARRLARQVPEAGDWARGATAVLVARELFAFDRKLCDPTRRDVDRLLGTRWRRATTIPDLRELLPTSAEWALASVASPADLWRSEPDVARRVANDANRLASSVRGTRGTVMAIMTLLLVDLWRVTVAIEAAGRATEEVFDDVA